MPQLLVVNRNLAVRFPTLLTEEERITMRLNRQVLLAVGLIMVQLCASVSVPTVSFAQSAAAPATVTASVPQPHATTGYPSWRDFNFYTTAIAVQGNYLWTASISRTAQLDVSYISQAVLTKWDTTTNRVIATYIDPEVLPIGPGSADVIKIIVDKAGNIWFSWLNLIKFDGTNWQDFNSGNSALPSGGIIEALTVDNNNNIWVATSNNAVVKFSGSNSQAYTGINGTDIQAGGFNSITVDKNGNIWAGFESNNYCYYNKPAGVSALDKFDGSNWTVYPTPTQNSVSYFTTFGLTTDNSDNVYASLYYYDDCNNPNGGSWTLGKFDGSNWQLYPNGGQFSQYMTTDSQGNIWGVNIDSIAEFNGTSWQSFQHPYRNNDPYIYEQSNYRQYSQIVIDASGNKWLAGDSLSGYGFYGLVKFNQTDAMLAQSDFGFDFNAVPGKSSPASQTLAVSAFNKDVTFSTAVSYTSSITGWLNVTSSTNTISAGGSQNVTLSVNATNLQSGVYTAEVIVTDQNDPANNLTVLVALRVGFVYYIPTIHIGQYSTNVIIQNSSNTATAHLTFEHYYSFENTGKTCTSLAPLAQCIVSNYSYDSFVNTKDATEQPPTADRSIITSDQPLNIVLTNPEYKGYGKSSVAISQSGSQLIAPLILNNAFGGYNTNLVIFNTTSDIVTATVQYYDQTGKLVPTATSTFNLLRYQSSLSPYQSTIGTLPDGFIGWAKITSSPGSNLAAQVVEENNNGFSAAFNAQVASSSTLYAPTIFNNAFGGYDTGASIVNPNPNPVTVTINYYDNNGNALPPASFTLQPYALTSIYQGGTQGKSGITGIPNGGLPDGFYGSATITSQGGGVAMLVNEIGPANNNVLASGSYTARPVANSTLTLPIICNGGYGYTTGLTVLNTSGAAVNATIQYFNTDGSPLKNANGSPITASFSVAAHGSYPIYQGAANLPNNFYGLAVVTTTSGPTNALIVTTNAISSDNFYTYTEPEM